MREGGVEAEQDGEGLTPSLRRCHELFVEGRSLDLCGNRGDLRIPNPAPALGVEFPGVEPIEQLAKEIGVICGHT